MVTIGCALASEEHGPRQLVDLAVAAERAEIIDLWVTDHVHPWVDRQGHSPFVWAVIGGIASATSRLRVGTGVTCPTFRLHPAIVAHAAATAAVMLEGRFWLGVGSGENLNEHILGDRWPSASVRLEMLEEAIDVIRTMWQPGQHSHHGRHYTVENARLYDLPEQPPPILMSAFGPKAMRLAGEVADGYVGTSPSAELVDGFRAAGGQDKPTVAEMKCCFHPDKTSAAHLVHELWPNLALPGQLAQELPTPAHFEQAAQLVTVEHLEGTLPMGDDPGVYAEAIDAYTDAGFDTVYVSNIGPNTADLLGFLAQKVGPRLR